MLKAFWTSMATVALALSWVGCSKSPRNGEGAGAVTSLVVYEGGDVNIREVYQKTLIPRFEQANPEYRVKLIFSEHAVNDSATLARVGASVQTHSAPPMDVLGGEVVRSAAQAGLLEKLSTAQLPNLAKIDPALLPPVNQSAAPYRGSAVVLAYNSVAVKAPPPTLEALLEWIKAHPGRFTYNSPHSGGSGHAFVETVLDKYMDPADVAKMAIGYDKSLQGSWQKGLEVLKGLKPAIYQQVYPNGNQEVLNLLAKGLIDIAPVWSDQALTAKRSGLLGEQIKLAQISDPPFTGGAVYVGVPVNSQHKVGAYKFIDFMLSSDFQVEVVRQLSGYPVVNLKTLPDELKSHLGDLDGNQLRPGYETKTAKDLNQAWQQHAA